MYNTRLMYVNIGKIDSFKSRDNRLSTEYSTCIILSIKTHLLNITHP